MKKNIYILILFIMNILNTSCNNPENKKYEYTVGLSTPPDYEVHIYDGAFMCPDKSFATMYQRSGTPIWGECHSGYIIGSDIHPAPDTLFLTWFAPIENKFYKGIFGVPRARIAELLEQRSEQTYPDKNLVVMKYDQLRVGILPAGEVVLWISSDSQNSQIELGRYQAKEIEMDWKEFCESCVSRAEYIKDFDKQREHISYDWYEIYHVRHPWKYSIELPEKRDKFMMRFQMINGEKEGIYTPDALNADQVNQRGVPFKAEFQWYDARGKKVDARVLFVENKEMFYRLYKGKDGVERRDAREERIYQLLQSIPADEPVEIVFKVKTEEYTFEGGIDVLVRTKDTTYNITPYVNTYIFPDDEF